ncbi:MAG: acetate--CoA ligase family protein [Burkholderiales bacterium]|nr:acetate--CoA ligase family protein [Burkholderiales bacterium]
MGRCLKALKRWVDYHDRRNSLLAHKATARLVPAPQGVEKMLAADGAGGRFLSEAGSKQVLAAYGVAVTRERLAQSADEAVKAAAEIGYPVVLKADSVDIPHKTEAGVVRLNLGDAQAVRTAHAQIMAAVGALAQKPRLAGISVQEMVRGGTEMIIGAHQDPQFGPMVTCGFGGIAVELTRDVATALAPVDVVQAEAMIRSLKGYPLLTGFRRTAVRNVKAFAESVSRVSELIADRGDEIEEIDVNPVMLDEHRAVAVDALVVRHARTDAS